MERYEIRARYDERTIRVYQAYSPEIAVPALREGRFVAPFKMGRMTWIKPSFNWMMYRCGFGMKPGQETVLGIDITREGFEWALQHAVLSHPSPGMYTSDSEWKRLLAEREVRVQWDPERDNAIREIPGIRSIQIGLSGQAVEKYVNEWIVAIKDLTSLAKAQGGGEVNVEWPEKDERPYPLPPAIAAGIVPQT